MASKKLARPKGKKGLALTALIIFFSISGSIGYKLKAWHEHNQRQTDIHSRNAERLQDLLQLRNQKMNIVNEEVTEYDKDK
jgi:hypothetical protein